MKPRQHLAAFQSACLAAILAADAAGTLCLSVAAMLTDLRRAPGAAAIAPSLPGYVAQQLGVAALLFLYGLVAALFVMLPVMPLAYPLGVAVARRLRRPAWVAGVGALLAPVIAVPVLVLAFRLVGEARSADPIGMDVARALRMLGLPAVAAGAAIGWVTAVAEGRRCGRPARI